MGDIPILMIIYYLYIIGFLNDGTSILINYTWFKIKPYHHITILNYPKTKSSPKNQHPRRHVSLDPPNCIAGEDSGLGTAIDSNLRFFGPVEIKDLQQKWDGYFLKSK